MAKDKDGKSELSETIDLIKRYVLQETVGPLKGLGRVLLFGLGGALLLGIGLVVLDVAILRALQNETGRTFAGHWSWAPYLLALVGALVMWLVAIVGLRRAGRSRRRSEPTVTL